MDGETPKRWRHGTGGVKVKVSNSLFSLADASSFEDRCAALLATVSDGIAKPVFTLPPLPHPHPPLPVTLRLPDDDLTPAGPLNTTIKMPKHPAILANAAQLSAASPVFRSLIRQAPQPPAAPSTLIQLYPINISYGPLNSVIALIGGESVKLNVDELRQVLAHADQMGFFTVRSLVERIVLDWAVTYPLFALTLGFSVLQLSYNVRQLLLDELMPRVEEILALDAFVDLQPVPLLALLRFPPLHSGGARERALFEAVLRWLRDHSPDEDKDAAADLLLALDFKLMSDEQRRQCWEEALAHPVYLSALLLPLLVHSYRPALPPDNLIPVVSQSSSFVSQLQLPKPTLSRDYYK